MMRPSHVPAEALAAVSALAWLAQGLGCSASSSAVQWASAQVMLWGGVSVLIEAKAAAPQGSLQAEADRAGLTMAAEGTAAAAEATSREAATQMMAVGAEASATGAAAVVTAPRAEVMAAEAEATVTAVAAEVMAAAAGKARPRTCRQGGGQIADAAFPDQCTMAQSNLARVRLE